MSILPAAHEEQRASRADQGHEHIFLRVPDIALGAEECEGRLAGNQRGYPFEQLIKRADSHTDEKHDPDPPAARTHNPQPNEQLARDQRRDKSLHEMSKPIEMISMPAKVRLDPIKERDAGVGIMTAGTEKHDVERDQGVNQSREAKA